MFDFLLKELFINLLHVCVAGLHLALHPTQVPRRLVLVVAPPRSAPTPATHPSAALSVAAALGIHLVCVCMCLHASKYT